MLSGWSKQTRLTTFTPTILQHIKVTCLASNAGRYSKPVAVTREHSSMLSLQSALVYMCRLFRLEIQAFFLIIHTKYYIE